MTALIVQEKLKLSPLCPHCRAEITTVDATPLRPAGAAAFGFGKRYLYACPSCRVVLGVSHRKGFWMG